MVGCCYNWNNNIFNKHFGLVSRVRFLRVRRRKGEKKYTAVDAPFARAHRPVAPWNRCQIRGLLSPKVCASWFGRVSPGTRSTNKKRSKIPPNNNIINNCRHRDTAATAVVTDTDTTAAAAAAAADDDVDFNIARCHVSRVCVHYILRVAVCARSSAHRPRTQTTAAASNGFMIFFFRFRLYLPFRFL